MVKGYKVVFWNSKKHKVFREVEIHANDAPTIWEAVAFASRHFYVLTGMKHPGKHVYAASVSTIIE